ncbi:MAG: hypothetical protein L6Q99_19460 [Planctomycetes bacterium]|nr:hypothetical protein [Planctomycetota bacterium]
MVSSSLHKACSFSAITFATMLPLSAQTITEIVREGDAIAGVGNVTYIGYPIVNDLGEVRQHVATDNPDPTLRTAFVDATGAPVFFSGVPVSQPPGAFIAAWGNVIDCSRVGQVVFTPYLGGTSGLLQDSGIYLGSSLQPVVYETSLCTDASAPPGSFYSIILPPWINESGALAFHGTLDDPAVSGNFNLDVLMKVDTATSVQTIFHREGDVLSGQSIGIYEFDRSSRGMAINDSGQVIWGATLLPNPYYSSVVYLDDTLLAQSGMPSPWGNYLYPTGATSGVDINNHGSWIYSAHTNDSAVDFGIVHDGASFVVCTEQLPAIAPFAVSEIAIPIFIGDNGRIAWIGIWDIPGSPQGAGVFVDYNLLIEKNVTRVSGLLVEDIAAAGPEFAMSPSGRYLVTHLILEGGIDAACLVDLGP